MALTDITGALGGGVTSPLGTPNPAAQQMSADQIKQMLEWANALRQNSPEGGQLGQQGPVIGPGNVPHFSPWQGASNLVNALRGRGQTNNLWNQFKGLQTGQGQDTANFQNPPDLSTGQGGGPALAPFQGGGLSQWPTTQGNWQSSNANPSSIWQYP